MSLEISIQPGLAFGVGKGAVSVVPNSETESGKVRRWSGFVCPDCRFVFRVPRDHDGEGIVCPSCRRMLRIPKEGEETAPLMAPLKKVDFAEDGDEPRGEKRTRFKRKRKKKNGEGPTWDPVSGKWNMKSSGRKRTVQTIAVWAAALVAFLFAVHLFRKAGEPDTTRRMDAIPDTQEDHADQSIFVPLIPAEEDASDPTEEK